MQATMEPPKRAKLDPCPVWFGGEWRDVNGVATTPVHNPSTGDVIAEAPLCAAAHVNEAVEAAGALSSEDARRFVNGILGKVASEVRS